MIWRISYSRFSDVLSAFTIASAIGNLCILSLGVNVLKLKRPGTLAMQAEIIELPVPSIGCNVNILI